MKMLTQARLQEVLRYNPDTGEFEWRAWRNGLKFGARPGSLNSEGYLKISIDGRPYAGHRLAWLYVYGRWPDGWLDHKNLVRGDNRISNLREANPSQNAMNRRQRRTSSSPFKGVCFHKLSGKWAAALAAGGRRKHLGLFATPEAARAAYLSAIQTMHGTFAVAL